MPKFLVDLSLDGYETPEEEAAACEAFIGEQLDFSASSVRVKRLEGMTLADWIKASSDVPQPEGNQVADAYESGVLDHSTCLHVIAKMLRVLGE